MKQGLYKEILFGIILMTAVPATALAAPVLSEPQMPQPPHSIEKPAVEEVQPQQKPAGDEKAKAAAFVLQSVRIEVEDMHQDEAALQSLMQGYLNRPVTMQELSKGIDAVTVYVRSHGYPAASAYIPEQKLENQQMVLKIEPGRYGKIIIDNRSKLHTDIAEGLSRSLKPGMIIRTGALERVLYIINDIGGIKAAGIMKPGAEVGTSDLTIRLEDGRRNMAALYAENYGSISTGRYRYSLNLNYRNLGGIGDTLNISAMLSNKDMRNYTFDYAALLGNTGTSVGIGYSRLNYDLGQTTLSSYGQADTYRLFATTPLIRRAKRRLSLNYGLNYRNLSDTIIFYGQDYAGEKHSQAFYAGLSGMEHSGKAIIEYGLTMETGSVVSETALAKSMSRAKNSEGRYTKGSLDINYLQGFNKYWDLLVKFQGQKASRNLDTSEQIYLGGANAVRAYPQSEGAGDEGYVATAELRYHTKCPGLMLSTYLDTGYVNVRRDGTQGETSLSGWGIGISYTKPQEWFARFDYARRIGFDSNASKEASSKDRMWFLLGKIF